VTAGALALLVAGCSSGSSGTTTSPTTGVSSTTSSTTAAAPKTSTTVQTSAAGCAPEPPSDRPDPYGTQVGWIQMVSSTRGYAVVGRAVVGTTDGRRWTVLYRAPEPLSYVNAPNANDVLVTGPHIVAASSDGGATWTVQPAQPAIRKPHFVNALLGWAVSARALVRSTDGARSWHAQRAPCPVDGVCFDTARDGWLATHRAVFHTADGGAQWTQALVAIDANAAYGSALDLQCSPNAGWVLFGGGNGAAGHEAYVGYRCAASGGCAIVVRNNFMAPAVPGKDGPGASPGPFSVIDDHTAAFVGYTGPVDPPMSIMIVGNDGSARGAVHQVPDPSSPPATPEAVSFTSASRGWLLDSTSSEMHILATTDGGRTWSLQYRGPAS